MPAVPTPSLRASGAAFGVLAGALAVLCAWLPAAGVAAVFMVLALTLAVGWPRLLDLPSPRGTAWVLALSGVALTAVMLASPDGARSRWAGAVVCVGLIGAFLHELLRQDGRPRLVYSVAGTALGLGVLGAGSYLVTNEHHPAARALMVAAGLAVALGCAVDGVAGATQRRLSLGLGQALLGGLVGAIAVIFADVPPALAMAVGALSGFVAWACLRTTVTSATSSHTRAQLAAGAAAALVVAFIPFAFAPLA